MKKGCCGMSITLNKKKEIKNLFIEGITIENNKFYVLLVTMFLMTMLLELLRSKFSNKNRIIVECFLEMVVYLIGWLLMTVCMTANFYIIFSICLGKGISKVFFRNNINKCCL